MHTAKHNRRFLALFLMVIVCLSLCIPALATEYTVAKGDTLWKIAERLLGSGRRWEAIYDANRDTVKDPNLILVGQKLQLPAIETPLIQYTHNPSQDPRVLADAVEDPTAIYGYSPRPDSGSLTDYANDPEAGIDWSDPVKVAEYRARREEYHAQNDGIALLVLKMKKQGCTVEEIARAANQQRNQNRLDDYIRNNDQAGLAAVKKRNLEKYGNEFGLTADDAFAKYGSWEIVIEKAMSANPAMDACCGLYDKYYYLYPLETTP